MSFSKKTVKDIDVKGKKVLVSVDYNVPGDDNGAVTSDERIQASIPTIKYLLEQNVAVALISHRGRPEGAYVKKFSLKPLLPIISKFLGEKVEFAEDCTGEAAQKAKQALKPGQVLLLENTRFHSEEEKNDAKFAKELAKNMDVFVQDAFGNAHREHASMVAVTKFLPSVAGLLVANEVSTILDVIENPKRPLMAILGGAKISDKIKILNRFIDMADVVVVGGAMANTFLLAEGINVGSSQIDRDDLDLAKDILKRARAKAKSKHFVFYLPQDGVVASVIDKKAKTRIVDWDAHVIATIENYPKKPSPKAIQMSKDEKILDLGPFSAAFVAGCIQLANTVIWNGTMGVTEVPSLQDPIGPFAHGTEVIVDAMLGEFGHKPFTLVGGGDTAGYLEQRHLVEHFDHVSTGGGASIELLAGKDLPGVTALQDK